VKSHTTTNPSIFFSIFYNIILISSWSQGSNLELAAILVSQPHSSQSYVVLPMSWTLMRQLSSSTGGRQQAGPKKCRVTWRSLLRLVMTNIPILNGPLAIVELNNGQTTAKVHISQLESIWFFVWFVTEPYNIQEPSVWELPNPQAIWSPQNAILVVGDLGRLFRIC